MTKRLIDKIAVVTGGASGLGKQIVSHFEQQGAIVYCTDVNPAGAKTASDRVTFVQHDVSDEDAWQQLILEVQSHHQGLDILINNAGIGDGLGPSGPEDTSWQEWQHIMSTNAGGVFLGCKHAIPLMRQSGGGAIVNISSIAALVATPFLTAYGASKAAVWQMTRSVAVHCAKDKIRCNSVHPGQIETPMLLGLFADVAAEANATENQIREDFLKRIPQGEFGTANDIADAVLFLASDEARHITGAQLSVDGGMSAHP